MDSLAGETLALIITPDYASLYLNERHMPVRDAELVGESVQQLDHLWLVHEGGRELAVVAAVSARLFSSRCSHRRPTCLLHSRPRVPHQQ